jgi:hypothetical protein
MKSIVMKQMLAMVIGALFLLSPLPLFAQTPPSKAPSQIKHPEFPPVKKVGPGVFRLGEIQIHKRARSVTFPAEVNMDKGLIEYVLVRSSGKTHESLLRTEVDPYLLHIAFLLLGFEGTDQPLAEQGDSGKPSGEPVKITLAYREKGEDKKSQRVSVEQWVVKKSNGESREVESMDWVFTGSKIQQGRFLAQVQGSIVAIYRDPVALIDNASPGGESDEIWFVKEKAVPPPGTSVFVVISARPKGA